MILLLTTEAGDLSHMEIVNWLEFHRADYMILTGESLLKGEIEFTYKRGELVCNGRNLSKDVNVVYYRRWLYPSGVILSKDRLLNQSLLENLYNETIEINVFLSSHLKKAVWIPPYQSVYVNKLTVLNLAQEVGLSVPSTIVTTSKSELLNFLRRCKYGCITKAIGNYTNIISDHGTWSKPIYTKAINIDFILTKCSSKFTISLFQEKIPKVIELRVFYFMGYFHTTAIISQNDTSTSIDSRISNNDVHSTITPYQLNEDVCKKLESLFKKLNLNIGSADMIVSPDNKFYFLEINPVGQMGGYFRRSGVNVEKLIVEKLIEMDLNHERNCGRVGN